MEDLSWVLPARRKDTMKGRSGVPDPGTEATRRPSSWTPLLPAVYRSQALPAPELSKKAESTLEELRQKRTKDWPAFPGAESPLRWPPV